MNTEIIWYFGVYGFFIPLKIRTPHLSETHPPTLIRTLFGFVNPYGILDDPLTLFTFMYWKLLSSTSYPSNKDKSLEIHKSSFMEMTITTQTFRDNLDGIVTAEGKKLLKRDISHVKIFVYGLPERFNEDILPCAMKIDNCFNFTNHGFGTELQFISNFTDGVRYYESHQFGLEPIFHQKLLQSVYITKDPVQADLFYVPFYAGLTCFCFEQWPQNLSSEFWNSLQDLKYLSTGKLHFLALAKIEQVR